MSQEKISFEGTYLNRDDYVRIGDIMDCLSELVVSEDAAFQAVGLIEWAMGKRAIPKEALLKSQKPMVMTPAEIEQMKPDEDTDDNFCWIEYRGGVTRLIHVNIVDHLLPCVQYPKGCKTLIYQTSSFGIQTKVHDQIYYLRNWYLHHADFDTYGITWRCWTLCPTNEQREAEKWNV